MIRKIAAQIGNTKISFRSNIFDMHYKDRGKLQELYMFPVQRKIDLQLHIQLTRALNKGVGVIYQ